MKTKRTQATSSGDRRLAKAKVTGFEMGLRAGATIASMLVEEGWKDLDKLPDEVVSRVTGRKRRLNLSGGHIHNVAL